MATSFAPGTKVKLTAKGESLFYSDPQFNIEPPSRALVPDELTIKEYSEWTGMWQLEELLYFTDGTLYGDGRFFLIDGEFEAA